MKTTELRLGNFVGIKETALHADGCNHLEAVFEIEEIKKYVVQFKDYHAGEYYKDLKPIPLTEQWLLDFGFEETIEESFIKEFDGATLIIFIINGVAELIYKHYSSYSENEIDVVNAVCLLSVEYVHQLQNLYSALTQEELILKERGKE